MAYFEVAGCRSKGAVTPAALRFDAAPPRTECAARAAPCLASCKRTLNAENDVAPHRTAPDTV